MAVLPAPAALPLLPYPVALRCIPRWVWAVLVSLHLLALGWQLHRPHPAFPDTDRYVQAARNLRADGVLYARPLTEQPLQAQEYSIRPPGYPVFLLLTGGAGTAPVPWGTLLVQGLLSLLNLALALAWLVRYAGRLRPRYWLAVVALTAAAPAQFIYASVLMSELVLQTAVVVLWLSLTELLRQPTRRGPQLLAAASAAVALLVKPVFYPFAGLFLLLGLYLAWQQRRLAVVWICAVPLLISLLWMARNDARTGYFHFSSIAEINLLRYNVRGVLQATEGPVAAEKFVQHTLAVANRQPTFRTQQQFIRQASAEALSRHPVAYAAQQGRGMLAFLLDPGRFDLVQFLGLTEGAGSGLQRLFNKRDYQGLLAALQLLPWGLLGALLLVLTANVVRLWLVLRFAFCRSYLWPVRLVLLMLVGYVALLTGPLGAARFAVPVLPLLLAAAGAGLRAGRVVPRAVPPALLTS